jgi:hypothetical protein
VKSLEKHPNILEALRRLASSLGQHAFVVVDHWEADDTAVGVASPHDSSRLVYIASPDGGPGLYYAELEFPPSAESDLPYTPGPSHSGVELTDLVRLVSEHLRGGR